MILVPLLVLALIGYVVASGRQGRSLDQPEIRAVRRGPSSAADPEERRRDWRIGRTLARREATLLLRNPAVLVGLALSLLSLPDVPFGLVGTEGSRFVLRAAVVQVGLAAFPLAGMTLIAVDLAVLRTRREGTAEVTDPAAATARARALGHLLSVLGPMAAWSLVLAVWFVWTVAQAGRARHGLDLAAVLELANGPVLVGCAGVCGVLVARLVPLGFAAPIAVVALGWLQAIAASPTPDTNRLVWLGWWVNDPAPAEVWPREAGWHLLYLVALGALVAGVATLVSGRTRGAAITVGAAVGVVIASALVQIQPLAGGEAAAAARWVNDPTAHQDCTTTEGVTTCAYPAYDFSDEWRRVAAGVVAAVPTGVEVPVVEVAQRLHPYELARVPREVRELLEPAIDGEAGGVRVTTEVRWGDDGASELVLATNLASALVGLPSEPAGSWKARGGCSVGGQARGVVALWLAARATADTGAAFRAWVAAPDAALVGLDEAMPAEPSSSHATLVLDGWSMTAGSPLTWSRSDLQIALELLGLPDEKVGRLLGAHWSDVLAPTTTTARLAELAGLRPPAPASTLDAGNPPTGRADAAGTLSGSPEMGPIGPVGPPCR